MAETPVSLLERLRDRPDPEAWRELVDLYTPLLGRWLRQQAVQPSDADDLVQEVLGVVVRELPHFRRGDRRGAFRAWLRTILVHRLRAFWRARQGRAVATGDSDLLRKLEQLEDPRSALHDLWDREHDRHVAQRLLERIGPAFEPTTWRAFRGVVLEGKRPAEVAAELGISANAVSIAKSRVLHRLRQEVRGLLD
jgi:RNA polymerase sigma-70 factor (ECF subfamily)